MSKSGNGRDVKHDQITIVTHPVVTLALKRLRNKGVFGSSLEDVAERLVCERIRQLIDEGWL